MMKTLLKIVVPALACLLLAGCGSLLKVGAVDPHTGHIDTGPGKAAKATVLVSQKVDLSKYKALAFTSNTGDYTVKQIEALGYFDKVVNSMQLQQLVVQQHLQDKVPSLTEPLDLNKLYHVYKPFLWIHLRVIRIGGPRIELVVTDPDTLRDVFLASAKVDLFWTGDTDQTTRYPLFNALIDWMNENK